MELFECGRSAILSLLRGAESAKESGSPKLCWAVIKWKSFHTFPAMCGRDLMSK